MMMMLTTSTDFLGLWIESGSELSTWIMSTCFVMHMLYDDFNYGFHIYELLMLSLLVDAGMVTLANPTHIWSK
jgi:hypothetical protein